MSIVPSKREIPERKGPRIENVLECIVYSVCRSRQGIHALSLPRMCMCMCMRTLTRSGECCTHGLGFSHTPQLHPFFPSGQIPHVSNASPTKKKKNASEENPRLHLTTVLAPEATKR